MAVNTSPFPEMVGGDMAIANVVDRGTMLWVYDERGNLLGQVPKWDGLQGFTPTTVSVRRGTMIYTCDERGSVLGQTLG